MIVLRLIRLLNKLWKIQKNSSKLMMILNQSLNKYTKIDLINTQTHIQNDRLQKHGKNIITIIN